jgi:hypothetical protein
MGICAARTGRAADSSPGRASKEKDGSYRYFGEGYCVSAGHDIGDDIPPENWIAMLRAIEKYG